MALTAAQKQRAYRERLAKAGKVLKLVDASSAPVAFDPETQIIVDRKEYEALSKARSRLKLVEEDRNRWQADCAKAEAELKREEQRHLNTLKDKIVLQQEIAALKAKPKRGKPG